MKRAANWARWGASVNWRRTRFPMWSKGRRASRFRVNPGCYPMNEMVTAPASPRPPHRRRRRLQCWLLGGSRRARRDGPAPRYGPESPAASRHLSPPPHPGTSGDGRRFHTQPQLDHAQPIDRPELPYRSIRRRVPGSLSSRGRGTSGYVVRTLTGRPIARDTLTAA